MSEYTFVTSRHGFMYVFGAIAPTCIYSEACSVKRVLASARQKQNCDAGIGNFGEHKFADWQAPALWNPPETAALEWLLILNI